MSRPGANTSGFKGQVWNQCGLSPAEGEIKARIEGERGSERLYYALWAAFERAALRRHITPDDARILLMDGYAL